MGMISIPNTQKNLSISFVYDTQKKIVYRVLGMAINSNPDFLCVNAWLCINCKIEIFYSDWLNCAKLKSMLKNHLSYIQIRSKTTLFSTRQIQIITLVIKKKPKISRDGISSTNIFLID